MLVGLIWAQTDGCRSIVEVEIGGEGGERGLDW